MADSKITRRSFIKGVSFAGVVFFVYSWKYLPALLKSSFQDPQTESDFFYKVSMFILAVSRETLDRSQSDLLAAHFCTNWSFRTTLRILNETALEFEQQDRKLEDLQQLPPFTRKGAQDIVSAWYTGVVEDDQKGFRRLFYEEALMFKLFSHHRPTPGNCIGGFGYWTQRPIVEPVIEFPQESRHD